MPAGFGLSLKLANYTFCAKPNLDITVSAIYPIRKKIENFHSYFERLYLKFQEKIFPEQ